MKVSTKKNDGVSPVIGTILLVAITVVLVAIISAVVMGMTGGIGTSHVVGVKVSADPAIAGNITVTITGGADANLLSKFYVYNGTNTTVGNQTKPDVGVPYAFKPGVGQASISIVGQFPDGNQTIYTGNLKL